MHINFLLGLCTLSDIPSSSKEEPHSDPPAAAVKADGLAPPPEGAVFTDEGEAEILKNNLAEEENFEAMDLHDEAAQTQGKNKIVTHLTLQLVWIFLKLWSWFINNRTTDQLINKRQ